MQAGEIISREEEKTRIGYVDIVQLFGDTVYGILRCTVVCAQVQNLALPLPSS